MSEHEATEVRDQLDQIRENSQVLSQIGGNETLEEKMEQVVENGSMVTSGDLEIEVSLTLRERLKGKRTQNVNAIFSLGIMLGTALERDVPIDSEKEDRWRDREFTLPER